VTKEEFEILVGKLDQLAKRNPAGYRARVLLVSLLGNAYLGVMLLPSGPCRNQEFCT
jgi:hypothetical protein